MAVRKRAIFTLKSVWEVWPFARAHDHFNWAVESLLALTKLHQLGSLDADLSLESNAFNSICGCFLIKCGESLLPREDRNYLGNVTSQRLEAFNTDAW